MNFWTLSRDNFFTIKWKQKLSTWLTDTFFLSNKTSKWKEMVRVNFPFNKKEVPNLSFYNIYNMFVNLCSSFSVKNKQKKKLSWNEFKKYFILVGITCFLWMNFYTISLFLFHIKIQFTFIFKFELI